MLHCFTSFSLFSFFTPQKIHFFHPFFYLLLPTLFYVDRCLSGLKIINDITIHVMAQIFKSGDLSNLIRSFDSISGGFYRTI